MTPTLIGSGKSGLEPAHVDAAAVGRERFKEPVLDHDRKAERDQERRQDVRSERAVEHLRLEGITDREHDWRSDERCDEGVKAKRGDEGQDQEGGEYDEIAVREIDEAHDAEDQRQAGRE